MRESKRYELSPVRGGATVNPDKCRARVYGSNWGGWAQCSRSAKYDGEWCGTHSPAALARKDAIEKARNAVWNKALDARKAERAHAQACVNALAGLRPERLAALLDACSIMLTNAELGDDPRMAGATDCWLVSIGDIEDVSDAYIALKGEA